MNQPANLAELQARAASGERFAGLHFRGRRRRDEDAISAAGPARWQALKLLGFALMAVRGLLA